MRVVLQWQVIATVVIAAAAMGLLGVHAGISAFLGGLVSVIATIVFIFVARMGASGTAGLALLAALRAEAVKVLVIVALLWGVMVGYRALVPVVFIATFIVAVLIQSMAFFVRDR